MECVHPLQTNSGSQLKSGPTGAGPSGVAFLLSPQSIYEHFRNSHSYFDPVHGASQPGPRLCDAKRHGRAPHVAPLDQLSHASLKPCAFGI